LNLGNERVYKWKIDLTMSAEDTFSASGIPGECGKLIDSFLEKSLGVAPSMFIAAGDNDWAAVIKFHAFIEASLNRLLVAHFQDERLYPIFARLDVSDQTKGKLAFVKALDLLPQEWRSFIRQFSEIRNDLVHDVRHLDFRLHDYLSKLPSQKRSELRKIVGSLLSDLVPDADKNWRTELIDRSPRGALALCVVALMRHIHIYSEINLLRSSNVDSKMPETTA
jgi:hypothetical protein